MLKKSCSYRNNGVFSESLEVLPETHLTEEFIQTGKTDQVSPWREKIKKLIQSSVIFVQNLCEQLRRSSRSPVCTPVWLTPESPEGLASSFLQAEGGVWLASGLRIFSVAFQVWHFLLQPVSESKSEVIILSRNIETFMQLLQFKADLLIFFFLKCVLLDV